MIKNEPFLLKMITNRLKMDQKWTVSPSPSCPATRNSHPQDRSLNFTSPGTDFCRSQGGDCCKTTPGFVSWCPMKATIQVLSTALLLAATGCGGDPALQEPPPPSFADYYAGEIFVIEKTRLEMGDSTTLAARLDSLRRRHGLTEARRDSLLAYCRSSLPGWEAFLREVLARLDAIEKAGAKGTEGKKEFPRGNGQGRTGG